MGQQTLHNQTDLNFESQHWVQAVQDTHNSRFANINPYRKRLLMNKNTSELIQEYELQFLNQEDFNSFLAQLQWRRQQKNNKKITLANRADAEMSSSPYIYKIRHFQNLSVKEMCSTIYNGLLYIDKVVLRLKQIKDIPFQDQLYLIQACLCGFKILYQKVGVFEINEEMIFFDQYGHVKVWMNPNLSSFQPNYQPQYYNNIEYNESQGSQTQMLRNLINIIEQNSDKQVENSNFLFKNYLFEKGLFDRLSFSKAIEYFDIYCEQHRLHVSTYLKSIYDLFHYDQANEIRSEAQVSEVGPVNMNGQYNFRPSESNRNTIVNRMREGDGQRSFKQVQQQSFMNSTDRFGQFLERSKASENNNSKNQFSETKINYQFNTKKKPESSFQLNEKMNNSHPINVFTDKISKPEHLQSINRVFRVSNESEPRKIITFRPNQINHKEGQVRHHNTYLNPQNKAEIQTPLTRYKSLDKNINLQGFHPKANITFNYQPKQQGLIRQRNEGSHNNQKQLIRKQSIIQTLNSPSFNSINSIQTGNNIFIRNEIVAHKRYNYFSPHSEYILDKEIADDMMKYLGFNPNTS